MKTVWLILFLTCGIWYFRAPIYSQEEPRIAPEKCEHSVLESWKNWVPPDYRELFFQFLFLQHLDNTGFNFCTFAEAKKRLSYLNQNPALHPHELKCQKIWVEVLEQWLLEEEEHWQKTLPKFLPSEQVEEVLKKLKQWKTHCSTCVQTLPPEYRAVCRIKSVLHRHSQIRPLQKKFHK